jgi:hypothetical protein
LALTALYRECWPRAHEARVSRVRWGFFKRSTKAALTLRAVSPISQYHRILLGAFRCRKPTPWSPIAQFLIPKSSPLTRNLRFRSKAVWGRTRHREYGLKERTVVTEFPSLEKATA